MHKFECASIKPIPNAVCFQPCGVEEVELADEQGQLMVTFTCTPHAHVTHNKRVKCMAWTHIMVYMTFTNF